MRGSMRVMNFAERMREARKASGLSLVEAAYRVRVWLPEAEWVGYDVIRRLEAGTTPEEKVDPVLLAALARAYGTDVADLSEVGEKAVSMVRELVSAGRGKGRSRSRCFLGPQPVAA